MARKLRVEYPGAFYHVIQRGNNREYVFERQVDKLFLVNQMRKAVNVDNIDIFAYVIMDNHYHIALRSGAEPLHKVMHRINTTFSMYYNREKGRTGHVFDGRYKAILVQNDQYLLPLVRYIHRNPVRAKLCASVKHYKWSSDQYYRNKILDFVNYQFILDILSKDQQRAFKEYNSLMEVREDLEMEDVSYIGTDDYAEKIYSYSKETVLAKPPLEEILFNTGASYKDIKLIRGGSRMKKLLPFKIAYAKAAANVGYSMKEIGNYINVSDVAVYKYLQK